MAILKKRAELERLDIDPEVMQYVATNINSNIRELEGALNKIFKRHHRMSKRSNTAANHGRCRRTLQYLCI